MDVGSIDSALLFTAPLAGAVRQRGYELGKGARSPFDCPSIPLAIPSRPPHNWLEDCNENQESKKRLAWRYTGVKFQSHSQIINGLPFSS